MFEASTFGQLGQRKAEARGVIDNGKGSNVSNYLSELSTITSFF
jgi:hypothetical protein